MTKWPDYRSSDNSAVQNCYIFVPFHVFRALKMRLILFSAALLASNLWFHAVSGMLIGSHRKFHLAASILIPIFMILISIVFSGCAFEGLLSSCEMTIGGIPVQASARINHCHKPIDVTFLLQSSMDHNKTVIFYWLTNRSDTHCSSYGRLIRVDVFSEQD